VALPIDRVSAFMSEQSRPFATVVNDEKADGRRLRAEAIARARALLAAGLLGDDRSALAEALISAMLERADAGALPQ
jgi:hypothetical protein